MNSKRSRWFRWQRGQAMAEYWPTIPAGIIIMLSAAGIVQFITSSLTRTVEGLEYTGAMECEMTTGTPETDGPLFAETSGKEFVITSDVEGTDTENPTTTITITVTDTTNPAISNIGLGMPRAVYEAIMDITVAGASGWKTEWVDPDPNAGIPGLKFEGLFDDGGGEEPLEGEEPAGGGKPPKKKSAGDIVLVGYAERSTGNSVTIILTLAGYYDWSITPVWVKAGTTVHYTEISLPAKLVEISNPDGC